VQIAFDIVDSIDLIAPTNYFYLPNQSLTGLSNFARRR